MKERTFRSVLIHLPPLDERMIQTDTIAAVATPPGVSAVAIIRISGPQSFAIARACFTPLRSRTHLPTARLERGWIHDPGTAEKLDDALAVHFRAPHSFTGEDVIELHVHGGAGVVASCMALVLGLGARLAHPGEFIKRAFLGGRMDLAQAEAVADLIAAESERASKAAAHRLAGSVGTELRRLRRQLLDRLIEIEAHLDYPDEVPAPASPPLIACVRGQSEAIAALLAGAAAARVLRDGISCVIAGPPNAGKSSLLNALLHAERAIVSDIPGTTRDVIEDRVAVEGVVLRLRDTAGLRDTADAIEAEGVKRARAAIGAAELVITVLDASRALGPDDRASLAQTDGLPRIILCNKLDLGAAGFNETRETFPTLSSSEGQALVAGSVFWPQTIGEVRAAIAKLGWGGAVDANRALVANLRQTEALTRAGEALSHAQTTLEKSLPIDLMSSDLRDAVAAYGEVTGETVTEEVLDGIFSRFCVGK